MKQKTANLSTKFRKSDSSWISCWALAGCSATRCKETYKNTLKLTAYGISFSLSATPAPGGRRCRALTCGKQSWPGANPQGVAGGGAVCASAGLLEKKNWIAVSNVQHLTRSPSSAKFLGIHQLPGSLKDWTCWKLHRCRAESEPSQ